MIKIWNPRGVAIWLLALGLAQGAMAAPQEVRPELFAPTAKLVADQDFIWAFSLHPNGRLALLQVGNLEHYSLYVSEISKKGVWSKPRPWALSETGMEESDPFFAPDGKTLYYASRKKPGQDKPAIDFDLWKVRFDGKSWGQPEPLGGQINSKADEFLPTVDRSGRLYFESGRDLSTSRFDLFTAPLEGETAGQVTPLAPLNTPGVEESPFVVPDGSLIVFVRDGALFASKRDKSGAFVSPKRLAITFAGQYVYSPVLDQKKQWLYFTSNEHGPSRIYRVAWRKVCPQEFC